MPESPRNDKFDDVRVEGIIGSLLRGGVVTAAIVVLAGGILYLAHFGMTRPDFGAFRGEPAHLRNIDGILSAANHGDSRGLIQLGLLLLIATPVARVAFSVYAFARERELKYVLFALVVFGLLCYSLFGSPSGSPGN
jgi:uncharacterized membrane protein